MRASESRRSGLRTLVTRCGLVSVVLVAVEAGCPKNINTDVPCSGHGTCDENALCQCGVGWDGHVCERKKCVRGNVWRYDGYFNEECSNRGDCFEGECTCHPSYNGKACQYLSCPNNCFGRGRCMNYESRHRGLSLPSLYTGWDRFELHGCSCDTAQSGYDATGYDCSLIECPRGDDPMTTGQVNELQLLNCKADGGKFGLRYPSSVMRGIDVPWDSTAEQLKLLINKLGYKTKVRFTYRGRDMDADARLCSSTGKAIAQIEYLFDFGQREPLQANFQYLGLSTVNVDADVKIATGSEPIGAVASVRSTKENTMCSSRGMCDMSVGDCLCYLVPMPGFRSSDGYGNPGDRGDCGAADDHKFYINPDGIIECPGEVACSGHGVCAGSPTFTCVCSDGWSSGDCSERNCPAAWPWFPSGYFNTLEQSQMESLIEPLPEECSNRGICDRTTGTCGCQPGFTGIACQVMDNCPMVKDEICSGHGSCVSAYRLARDSGLTDAEMTFHGPWMQRRYGHNLLACQCDEGWIGWNCIRRECPRGNYPITPGVMEKQIIRCQANNGTFRLGWGEELTPQIPYDASAAEVKQLLERMHMLEEVVVGYTSSIDRACSNVSDVRGQWGGSNDDLINYISIEFKWPIVYDYKGIVGQKSYLLEGENFPNLTVAVDNLQNFTEFDGSGAPIEFGNTTLDIATKGHHFENNSFTSVTGTRKWLECSGRGRCIYEYGDCECFKGYSGSDGFGNRGNRRDCGHISTYQVQL